MKKKELYINCGCFHLKEMMRVSMWDEQTEQYLLEVTCNDTSLWHRIKMVYNILRGTADYSYVDFIIRKKDARRLSNYLKGGK
jgi:hypothetical protein